MPGETRPTSLEYAVSFREERLADGTLRVMVMTDRKRAIKNLVTIAVLGLLSSIMLGVLWYFTGSVKAGVFAIVFGPMTVMFAGGAAAVQFMQPPTQIHTVDVNRETLVVNGWIAGMHETKRHRIEEIAEVRSTKTALEIHTVRDSYSCIAHAAVKDLERAAKLVNGELARVRAT